MSTADPDTAMKTAPLARAVLDGDRRALARAITLIESTRRDHRDQAEALMEELMPHVGGAIRIGISGAPGVGKSTFIEALSLHAIEQGRKVAVLAVDPSSKRGGGSILGDKTRMPELSQSENSFIRPSPSGGTLGGVARRTHEALLACEAAGFDTAIVETVGVGQSETAVADMVDMFLLLLLPAGGDDLQGIKKGIMEMADLLVVNKADGDLETTARRTAGDYGNALRLIRSSCPEWTPRALTCSALQGEGITDIWRGIEEFNDLRADSGGLGQRRADQARAWMWSEIDEGLRARLHDHKRVEKMITRLESDVAQGKMTPTAAAQKILGVFLEE